MALFFISRFSNHPNCPEMIPAFHFFLLLNFACTMLSPNKINNLTEESGPFWGTDLKTVFSALQVISGYS